MNKPHEALRYAHVILYFPTEVISYFEVGPI